MLGQQSCQPLQFTQLATLLLFSIYQNSSSQQPTLWNCLNMMTSTWLLASLPKSSPQPLPLSTWSLDLQRCSTFQDNPDLLRCSPQLHSTDTSLLQPLARMFWHN